MVYGYMLSCFVFKLGFKNFEISWGFSILVVRGLLNKMNLFVFYKIFVNYVIFFVLILEIKKINTLINSRIVVIICGKF